MSNFAKKFKDSALELRNLSNLCISAVLVGLSVVLYLFQIPVTPEIYIRFGFIAIGMIGWLYGPVMSGICAGISDLLCILLIPTGGGFFFGFTVSAILTGIIYGSVLYQQKMTPFRVLLAMLLVGVLVNIMLNTYWTTILYGKGFFALFPARILKNIITIALNSFIFFAIAKPLSAACKKLGLINYKAKKI